MSDHIEARILALAEAATPGPWETGNGPASIERVYQARTRYQIADCSADNGLPIRANAALIAALDPSTVILLARVVEQTRTVPHLHHFIAEDGQPAMSVAVEHQSPTCDLCEARRALDAAQEENRP